MLLWCLLLSWIQCLVSMSVWECSGFGLQQCDGIDGSDGMCVLPWGRSFGVKSPLQRAGKTPEGILQKGNNALGFSAQNSYSSALPSALFLSWFDLLIHVQMQELFFCFQCCILKYPEMCKRVLGTRTAFICIRLFHFVLDSEWNISEQELPVNCAVVGDLSFLGPIGHFSTGNLIYPKA